MPVASQLALLVKRSFGERITFVGTAIVDRKDLILDPIQNDLQGRLVEHHGPRSKSIPGGGTLPGHATGSSVKERIENGNGEHLAVRRI